MRLAISNIAWDVAEDETVLALLQKHQVDAIDIAPGKYFPKPENATRADILTLKHWWADKGIEITGMQALLFGTSGLNVFGDQDSRKRLLDHLEAVCRIGGELGSSRLVFGSPKNRDRSGLDDNEAVGQAVDFFRQAGDRAAQAGVCLCLEPTPICYDANFMINSSETAFVVRAVNHPAIRMQFDTGAITINAESPERVLASHADLIAHVHASEPALAPLGDKGTDHHALARALLKHLPNAIISIEMLATQDEPHLVAIERALKVASDAYRTSPIGGAT